MLRHKLGDDTFFKGLQQYYTTYRNSSALTSDFRKIMEEVSSKDLKSFFNQWLRQAGHPVLSWNWKQTSDKNIEIRVEQIQQQALFSFLLDLEFQYINGEKDTFQIDVSEQNTHKILSVKGVVQNVIPDPGFNLLFEEEK